MSPAVSKNYYEDATTVTPSENDSPSVSNNTDDYSGWRSVVERIRAEDPSGMEDLYKLFAKGIRFYLYRQLGPQELEDTVHDTFLIVVQAIRNGELREPDRLMGFVRTVVRRQVAQHIEEVVHCRREHNPIEPNTVLPDRSQSPEDNAQCKERLEFMVRTLRGMSARDREILTRFYLQEQTQQQICEEMELTETQFRLLKSRAKARFGEMGRRRLERGKEPKNIFVRTFQRLRH